MSKRELIDNNGIIVGRRMNGEIVLQRNSSRLANRNHLVVGGPGSYKSQSYVVTNLLHEKVSSLVVTDPKEELYSMTSEIKKRQGYEIYYINYVDMAKSCGYNPLDYIKTDIDAGTVAYAIVASKNNPEKKDVWFTAQQALLKSLILYVIHEEPVEKRNISGVLDLIQNNSIKIDDDTGTCELDEIFFALKSDHPARRSYELGFQKIEAEETRNGVIMSFLTTLADYTDATVAKFTSHSDFLFSELGQRKIILYVAIPAIDKSWEGLLNLMFTQMFQALYDSARFNNARLKNDLIMFLDEFPSLGKIEAYQDFLATCRGYGISCNTIIQNVDQMYARYGKELAGAILGNHAIKICQGNVNPESAKYFSDLCGTGTVKIRTAGNSESSGKNGSASKSENESYIAKKVMSEGDIQAMNAEKEVLIVATGINPIILKKAKQFEIFPDVVKKFRNSDLSYTPVMSEKVKKIYADLQGKYNAKNGIIDEQKLESVASEERNKGVKHDEFINDVKKENENEVDTKIESEVEMEELEKESDNVKVNKDNSFYSQFDDFLGQRGDDNE